MNWRAKWKLLNWAIANILIIVGDSVKVRDSYRSIK